MIVSPPRVMLRSSADVAILLPDPADQHSVVPTDSSSTNDMLVRVKKALTSTLNPTVFFAKFYPGAMTNEADFPRTVPTDATELVSDGSSTDTFSALVPVETNINGRCPLQTLVVWPNEGEFGSKSFHVTSYSQFVKINFTAPATAEVEVNYDGTISVQVSDPDDWTLNCYAKVFPGTIDIDAIPTDFSGSDPGIVQLTANSASPPVFSGIINAGDVRLAGNVNRTLVIWPSGSFSQWMPVVKHFAVKLPANSTFSAVPLSAKNAIWFAWAEDNFTGPSGETLADGNRPARLVVPYDADKFTLTVNGTTQPMWEMNSETASELDGTGSEGVGLEEPGYYQNSTYHSEQITEDDEILIGKLVGFWGSRSDQDAQEIPVGKGPVNVDLPANPPLPVRWFFLGCHDFANWYENQNLTYTITATVVWS